MSQQYASERLSSRALCRTMVYLFTWKMHYVPSCVPELTEDKRQWIRIRGTTYDVRRALAIDPIGPS